MLMRLPEALTLAAAVLLICALATGCGEPDNRRLVSIAGECIPVSTSGTRAGSASEVDELIRERGLAAIVPAERRGLTDLTIYDLSDANAFQIGFGSTDIDREGIALLYSPAAEPRCSVGRGEEPVFDDGRVVIYQIEGGRSTIYVTDVQLDETSVQLAVFWAPTHAPPDLEDRFAVVVEWVRILQQE